MVCVYDYQTHRVTEHWRPDISDLNTTENESQIMDLPIPADYNTVANQTEKISNYSHLKVEIDSLCKIPNKML